MKFYSLFNVNFRDNFTNLEITSASGIHNTIVATLLRESYTDTTTTTMTGSNRDSLTPTLLTEVTDTLVFQGLPRSLNPLSTLAANVWGDPAAVFTLVVSVHILGDLLWILPWVVWGVLIPSRATFIQLFK